MKNNKLKIIFFGTPHFAEKILEKIIAEKYHVAAVFTQPDKKAGRKRILVKSPVKIFAEKHSIPVYEPRNLRQEDVKNSLVKLQPDLIIVAAYGKILPQSILKIPKYGAINIHASLLPKFRGASPIQEAILSGKSKTGVTLMLMNEKLDSGRIINQEKIAIKKNDNILSLTEKLACTAGKILIETLPLWTSGAIKAVPQNEKEATYCRTIKKEDGKINWSEPAGKIYAKFRAYQSWPGIFTFFSQKKEKKRLKILEIEKEINAQTGNKPGKVVKYKNKFAVQTRKGLIILHKIQLEGKKTMSADDFAKGYKNFLGSILE